MHTIATTRPQYFQLSKEDSKMLQGVAVLFMLYHHLFGFSDRTPKNLLLHDLGGTSVEQIVAIVMCTCVPIYVFLTGYGHSASDKVLTPSSSFAAQIGRCFAISLQSLGKFISKYWLVLVIFLPYGFFSGTFSFAWDTLFLTILGLDCKYNAEFWYVGEYIRLLLFTPLARTSFIYFFNKEKRGSMLAKCIVSVVAIAVSCFLMDRIATIVAYALGFAFEKIQRKIPEPSQNNFVFGVLFLLFEILSLLFFVIPSGQPISLWLAIASPITVFSLTEMLRHSRMSLVLQWYGKLSLWIWLTHTFFCYYYAKKIIYAPRYPFTVFAWLLLVSTVAAIVLEKIHIFCRKANKYFPNFSLHFELIK
ncbi:MAG: acyltransferase family protein [Ruthenibacterium sp.]